MKIARIPLMLTILAFFAFATMAPHFTTLDSFRSVVAFDTKIVALSLKSGDNVATGKTELEFRGTTQDGRPINGHGVMRFQARCISPLCGGFAVGPVEMRGEIKFRGLLGDTRVSGQGTLSGPVVITRDAEGGFRLISGDGGVVLRARAGS